MKKLTKKTYEASLAAFQAELEAVRAILALAAQTEGASLPDIDMWDEYHDREDEIEASIRDLGTKWSRRHWTTADYNRHTLIADNID